ncbi:hypothetical protein ANN_26746 [Periplaneta americana]|uniref:Uncharacterized protein n=1 Tax=Periplaneta americana TaxID=6978 RepID=A0ABQ8RZ71_PERAM|nr:hypothetical protein ANN_26746 [Periplaneta americana]
MAGLCEGGNEPSGSLKAIFADALINDRLLASDLILQKLNDPTTKLYLQFLDFILPLFNSLNIKMQSETPQIHTLYRDVEGTFRTILDCYMKEGYLEKTPLKDVEYRNPSYFKSLDDIYFGAKVALNIQRNTDIRAEQVKGFKVRCLDFFIEGAQQLFKRFSFGDTVIKDLEALDPNCVRNKKISSIANLASNFPNLVKDDDLQELDTEWRLLRNINIVQAEVKSVTPTEFWMARKLGRSADENKQAQRTALKERYTNTHNPKATQQREGKKTEDWNVECKDSSASRYSKLENLKEEMRINRVDVMGISEVRYSATASLYATYGLADEEAEESYDKVVEIVEQEKKGACVILMGDWNAVVREGQEGRTVGLGRIFGADINSDHVLLIGEVDIRLKKVRGKQVMKKLNMEKLKNEEKEENLKGFVKAMFGAVGWLVSLVCAANCSADKMDIRLLLVVFLILAVMSRTEDLYFILKLCRENLKADTVRYCEEHELLASHYDCPTCGKNMKLAPKSDAIDGVHWTVGQCKVNRVRVMKCVRDEAVIHRSGTDSRERDSREREREHASEVPSGAGGDNVPYWRSPYYVFTDFSSSPFFPAEHRVALIQ